MKKILILLVSSIFILCGCKSMKSSIVDSFKKDVENSSSYKLEATMNIYNDEETYSYEIEANYLKDNYYKVILTNKTNDHKQIILRNDDGVYVITPSLNKSFKFDSIWPDNSSQSYLLKSLLSDILNDNEKEEEKTDNYYIVKSKVNYPNNTELKYQKIYFNNSKTIDHIEVYNENNEKRIDVSFKTIDLDANLKKENFNLNEYIDNNNETTCDDEKCEEKDNTKEEKETKTQEEKTSVTDNIIYPLYIPQNTYLTGTDTVNNEENDRVILSFTGEKNFCLIEQPAKSNSVFEVIPVYGDPIMINDTVGAMGTNSIYWATGGNDYYIVSNDLTKDELVSVASSINNNMSVANTK